MSGSGVCVASGKQLTEWLRSLLTQQVVILVWKVQHWVFSTALLCAYRWFHGRARGIDCLRLNLIWSERLWEIFLAGLCGWLDGGSRLRIIMIDEGTSHNDQIQS